MVGKKSGRALLREEGLQRTDNNMEFTTWPQVNMINQKNYYTEFLKRDDQILALRLQHDETLDRTVKTARDRDRALAQGGQNGLTFAEADADIDEDIPMDDVDAEASGSRIIVIHPGSQNLRIGLATDVLPKTVPMVIAHKAARSEAEDSEPRPKRIKLGQSSEEDKRWFGEDFAKDYHAMAADSKVSRRANKRRVLPNSRDLVTKWNQVTPPETIPEHSDPLRIDWTELPANPAKAPEYIVGQEALRIPEKSKPRYRLFWPMQYGWLNENAYTDKNMLHRDFFLILEESIKSQLGLRNKKDWAQYSCVFVIPDLYEKVLCSTVLHELMIGFGFQRVCFFQESLAATFGAGYGIACVVDIGAQKTSIACVEDGVVIEDSRVNLKYGGYDVTETFVKMMLHDRLNYSDFNLTRRHDFLVAEELKEAYTTFDDSNIAVYSYDFHVRAYGEITRKYTFKLYDEGMLAALGFFRPSVFDHSVKLVGRRKLIPRSVDLYDGSPNDHVSIAQLAIFSYVDKNVPAAVMSPPAKSGRLLGTPTAVPAPLKQKHLGLLGSHMNSTNGDETPRNSVAGSPPPEDIGTPQPGAEGTMPLAGVEGPRPDADRIDRTVPIMPLDQAVLTSINAGGKDDERRRRDFLGSIMLIGGGSKTPNFGPYLEQRLKNALPQYPKEILVASAPREIDPQVLVWKGAAVFGKLRQTNDSWIGQLEYDRLGSRVLNYKAIWAW